MDASTGNSDNTTDGQHGGSNEVMDAPLLLRSLGDGYSTSDGHHTDDGHSQGDKAKALVIKRHANYIKRKYARHTSYRKKRTYTSKIMADCKGIGKVIEEYVQSRNVGADAWRRTGVLTFDGNRKLKKKQRIHGYNPILKTCLSAKLDLEQLFNCVWQEISVDCLLSVTKGLQKLHQGVQGKGSN